MSVLLCLGIAVCCAQEWCVMFMIEGYEAYFSSERFYQSAPPTPKIAPSTQG